MTTPRLFTYQSRQFTAGDLSLKAINGVQWNAAVPAAVIATASPLSALPCCGCSVCRRGGRCCSFPVPALVVYVRMARDRAGGLTESEKHRLAWNFRYRQPREVLGLGENTEPTDFAWDVIFWVPPAGPAAGDRNSPVTVLIVVILVVPAVLFGSYRIQRARALKREELRATGTGLRWPG